MNHRKWMSGMLILSLLASGCSVFRSKEQYVRVTTNKPDASIYINGRLAGEGSSGSAFVKRNKTALIVVTKEGSYRVERPVRKSLNKVGILDLIGGCLWLVPFAGLATAGAYSLKEDNIHINVE
jgi:hypothetical protein